MQRIALSARSVLPTAFQVGAIVKFLASGSNSEGAQSGVVTHIIPETGKVHVSWPVTGNQQHEPDELLIVTDGHGLESGLSFDNGYESYEKWLSNKRFGKLTPQGVMKVASSAIPDEGQNRIAALCFTKAALYKMAGLSAEAAIEVETTRNAGDLDKDTIEAVVKAAFDESKNQDNGGDNSDGDE